MTDTLSPMPNLTMPSYQHGAYQRLLLAEMGITPWVGQSATVQTYAIEEIFTSFTEINPPTISQPTNFSQPTIGKIDKQRPTSLSPTLGTPASPTDVDVSGSRPSMPQVPIAQPSPVIRCHCYAIKIQDWVIVADGDFLNAHPQTLQLWQSIVHNLSAHLYEFRFPFIENPQGHSETSTLLVQASFAGFLRSIQRGVYLEHGQEISLVKNLSPMTQSLQKVGIVTPMAACLENENLRRLPYLTEMLEDYRQKRQFWQLIIAN